MELSSLRFPAITPHCSTSSSLPPILFGPPLQNRLLFSQAAGQSCTQLGCPEAAPNPCLAARRGEIPSGFEISTFATKLGVRNIAFLGSGLLLLNYVGSVFAASLMPEAFRRSLMIPMHAILALSLVFQEASANYYRFIWNLFYAEYILFPFI